jgi:hypothetical protein
VHVCEVGIGLSNIMSIYVDGSRSIAPGESRLELGCFAEVLFEINK